MVQAGGRGDGAEREMVGRRCRWGRGGRQCGRGRGRGGGEAVREVDFQGTGAGRGWGDGEGDGGGRQGREAAGKYWWGGTRVPVRKGWGEF